MNNMFAGFISKNELVDLLSRKSSYSDIELTLTNGSEKKLLYVHKIILKKCRYFKNTFSFYKNSRSCDGIEYESSYEYDSIEIEVPHINIACDIIYLLYGIELPESTDWKHKIHLHLLQDFFLLQPISVSDLEIPENDFESLINEIISFGHTDQIIKLIFDNMPESFDVEKIPKNILEIIFNSNKKTYQILDKIKNAIS